jgi:hypothetical protein
LTVNELNVANNFSMTPNPDAMQRKDRAADLKPFDLRKRVGDYALETVSTGYALR